MSKGGAGGPRRGGPAGRPRTQGAPAGPPGCDPPPHPDHPPSRPPDPRPLGERPLEDADELEVRIAEPDKPVEGPERVVPAAAGRREAKLPFELRRRRRRGGRRGPPPRAARGPPRGRSATR